MTKEEVIPATGNGSGSSQQGQQDPSSSQGKSSDAGSQGQSAGTSGETSAVSQPAATETDRWGNVLVSEQQMEAAILAQPNDNDPAGSTFSLLQAKVVKAGKTSITLGWKLVPGANSYTVFGNRCGNGNRFEKLAKNDDGSKFVRTHNSSFCLKNLLPGILLKM